MYVYTNSLQQIRSFTESFARQLEFLTSHTPLMREIYNRR